jgi:fumarate reductase (CoM/CoB) subunit A
VAPCARAQIHFIAGSQRNCPLSNQSEAASLTSASILFGCVLASKTATSATCVDNGEGDCHTDSLNTAKRRDDVDFALAETLSADVVAVGGGAAACMAAIAAHQAGARSLIVDKGQLGKSGCSPNAHGGMAIYHKDPADSWFVHLEDTLMSGGFLNDQELVRVLCTEGRPFLDRLESFGCLFDRDEDGRPSVRPFGGHRYRRTVFSGDETGHEMMNGLKREVLRRGIPFLDEHMAVKILRDDSRVVGVLVWNIAAGSFLYIKTPAVVLGTADAAGIWPSASERQRGDGLHLALDVGAELADMEFIQYHPTHAWWPYGVRGSVSESFRGEGGWLLNSEGERFMERYDPKQKELATRDKVSVCIIREIRAGRGAPHGGIYVSVAHLSEEHVKRRLRLIHRKFMSYGYDITKEPIEVRPRPHYHCGGVVINGRAETAVAGLYAAGAVTAGVHGANRLGSNALVDILVFGDIAGRNAAAYGKAASGVPVLESKSRDVLAWIRGLFQSSKTDRCIPNGPLRRKHIEMMDQHMGIVRDEPGMRHTLEEIERAKYEDLSRLRVFDSSRVYNYELRDVLEMFYRVEVEEMATRAALDRAESRGTHYREDYPERRDDMWLYNIIFRRDSETSELRSEKRPVDQSIIRLEALKDYAAQTSPWH